MVCGAPGYSPAAEMTFAFKKKTRILTVPVLLRS